MGFTALVASDIFGEKCNIEIAFSARPSLAELKEVVERCYDAEVSERLPRLSLRSDGRGRPPAVPPYCVKRFQLFDELAQRWVDLSSSNQLTDYCQLYAFQPPNPWHKEVRAPIPAPVKVRAHLLVSTSAAARAESVARSRVAGDGPLVNPLGASHDEKTASVFDELDVNNDRTVDPEEWGNGIALLRLDQQFGTEVVRDLFAKADANADGRIHYPEWQRFTEMYPALLDSLYQRCQGYWEDRRFEQQLQDAQERLEALKAASQRADDTQRGVVDDVAARERALGEQEGVVRSKGDALRGAEDAARDAGRDAERAQKQLGAAEADLALQREKERLRDRSHDELCGEVAAAQERAALARAHVGECDNRARQLEQQLAGARGQLEHEAGRTQAARDDLAATQAVLQGAAEQRKQAAVEQGLAADALVQAEGEVSAAEGRARDADSELKDARMNLSRALAVRDEEERAMAAQRDREQSCNKQRIMQEKLTEEHAQRVSDLDEDQKALRSQMDDAVAREQPLIEEELRLRNQRSSLEEKESVLRHDHRSFYAATFAGQSPARSMSVRRK